MTLSKLFKTIDKKEWQFVFLVALLVIVITTLPYLYGWYKTPPNKIYTGIHFLVPSDYPVYYSYIQQASQGQILFSDLYSGETTQRNILNTFWLIPGWLVRFFNFSPILAFQLSRLLFIPVLMAVSYLLISYFFINKNLRKFSFLLFIFAAGWGFYYLLFDYHKFAYLLAGGKYIWPLDFWGIEAFTFFKPILLGSFYCLLGLTLVNFIINFFGL